MRSAIAFFALCLAALPAVASSGTAIGAGGLKASASIDLAIVVPRMLRMQLLDQPGTIQVTSQDVANGVVIVDGARLELLSNDRRGYWLDASLQGPFAEATIEGLQVPMHIDAAGGRILMPSMVGLPRPEPYRVRYELRLREGAQPGTYRWPVALSIESP